MSATFVATAPVMRTICWTGSAPRSESRSPAGGGRIGFAISAVMSPQSAQTIAKSAVITLLLLFAGIVADSLAP